VNELIVGPNPVLECLRSEWITLDALYVADAASGERIDALRRAADEAGLSVRTTLPADRREQLEAAPGRSSRGVVAVLESWSTLPLEGLLERIPSSDRPGRLLVLDEVQDPVNAGKLFRAAAFFGVDGVVMSTDRTVPLSGTVLRTSAGGAARVPVARVTNLRRALETLRDERFWLVGAVPSGGRSPDEIPRDRRLAIVLGSEGSGLRRLTRESCDYLVSLEGGGDFDSLNVAAAGTVLLYVLRPPADGEAPPAD